MLALILRHKATVGITPPGVIIVHKTHEPVLVGTTPLSKVLLRDYSKGFRFYVYDRKSYTKKEKIIPAKDFDTFLAAGTTYYNYANMTLAQLPYSEEDTRLINIDGVDYSVGEI